MTEAAFYYHVLTLMFLADYTLTDLWKGWIWWPLAMIFMVSMLAVHGILKDAEWIYLLGGVVLGLILLAVSRVTEESIGYGDGLTVAACGAALGFFQAFAIFALAVCFAAVWSGVLLVTGGAGRKDSFPFDPFLLAAQVCLGIGGMGGI